jgi:hypothetical protein
MMRRLVAHEGSRDPVVSRAAALLRAAQGSSPGDAMRRRVLASVIRDHPSSFRRRWLARSAAFAAVLFATTVAAGALQRGWLPTAYHFVTEHAPILRFWHASRDHTPTPTIAALAVPQTREDTPALAAPLPEFEPPAAIDPIAAALPEPERAHTAGSKHRSRKIEAASGAPADVAVPAPATPDRPDVVGARWSEGAALVIAAIQSLRRGHDPVHAGELLEEYLRKYPVGALREEAMALAVEASSSRGDARVTRQLARRYERSFPDGRFRQHMPTAP